MITVLFGWLFSELAVYTRRREPLHSWEINKFACVKWIGIENLLIEAWERQAEREKERERARNLGKFTCVKMDLYNKILMWVNLRTHIRRPTHLQPSGCKWYRIVDHGRSTVCTFFSTPYHLRVWARLCACVRFTKTFVNDRPRMSIVSSIERFGNYGAVWFPIAKL